MLRHTKVTTGALLYTAGRILLGGVFIWASWDKIIEPAAFAQAIANYQIVPATIGNPVALILPWVELACGACLILNRWTRGSALVAAALMLIFMGALGYNIYRGIDVNCGCFTLDETAPGNMWLYLVRDAVFLAMAIGVMCRPRLTTQSSAPI
jgi:uncharacterized membrane protein YphA (DoxX/SURF4 family)